MDETPQGIGTEPRGTAHPRTFWWHRIKNPLAQKIRREKSDLKFWGECGWLSEWPNTFNQTR
jgi:hypothetical protein